MSQLPFILEGKSMKIVTRATAIKNLKKYIGKDLAELTVQFGINPFLNGKQNKGWKGLVLERLAGLQTNVSKAPNGLTIEANHECFHRRYVDELWLFGDRISAGMEKEVLLAQEMNIPIVPKTEGTKRDLERLELKS